MKRFSKATVLFLFPQIEYSRMRRVLQVYFYFSQDKAVVWMMFIYNVRSDKFHQLALM